MIPWSSQEPCDESLCPALQCPVLPVLDAATPPHTHIHSSGRDTALPPSAATMKKRPALLSPSSGEGAIFLFLPTGWQGRQLDGAQEWAQNSSGPPHIQAGGSHQG